MKIISPALQFYSQSSERYLKFKAVSSTSSTNNAYNLLKDRLKTREKNLEMTRGKIRKLI